MRILIVDDSEPVRRGIRQILSQEVSWEICAEAAGGAEGIEKAQVLKPDVVLLDVNLPGMSGMETARVLKNGMPHLRIVMMSQNDVRLLEKSALGACADACVDKAVIATTLISTLESVGLGSS
jgi:two-component system nitrate/nitrite response regulator NarL